MVMEGSRKPGGADIKFGFEVYAPDKGYVFIPEYYPSRFKVKKHRNIEGEADSCKGENLKLKNIENARIHVKGFLLYDNSLKDFQDLADYKRSKVDVINPVLPGSGIECLIEDADYGEIKGYDPQTDDWFVNYTFDFISTGKDESSSTSGPSGVVDELG